METMNKSLFDRAQMARELWEGLLPFCQTPDMPQLMLWCHRYTDSQIERGFFRAGRKFAHEQYADPGAVWKYSGSVMKHERETGRKLVAHNATIQTIAQGVSQ